MELMICFLESFTVFPYDFINLERELYLWLWEYRKQKGEKEREKPQILKLSIKLVQAFPWHFLLGGNQSPITSVWMGTH